MLDPSDVNRKFDYRNFGDQFFIRQSDSLEIDNQISNKKFEAQIQKLQSYYKDFTNKIPDIGKKEIIESAKKNIGKK